MRNDKLRSKEFYRFFNLGGTPVAKTPPPSVLILVTDTGFWMLVSGVSPAAGLKSGQLNRNRNFWGTVPKSVVVGFRIS
jgi:hypothetical protein